MRSTTLEPSASDPPERRPPGDAPAPTPAPRSAVGVRLADLTRWVTFASFVVVAAAAVVGNWLRTQDVDPQYTYDLVHRTIHFGGTYFENGIQDKGPLEPFVYHVAAWITSPDGFWYGISLFVAIAAGILGWTAARTARTTGANRDLALAAAVVTFVHFTFSGARYAGVLYARNMTTALLALVWIAALSRAPWATPRRARTTVLATGAALGLAVQTLMTTALSGSAVAVMLLGAITLNRPRSERVRLARDFCGAGALAFLSAPIWYLLRGRFTVFFSGWWTYARFLNTGTGRSLGTQLALGWDELYAYYQDRPLTALAILAFLAMASLEWRRADRRHRLVYGTLVAWLAGAWIEMILSQRYSAHYFSITTVPTALMIAALAGRAYHALVESRGPVRGSVAWPLVALVLSIYLSGPAPFVSAVHDLSSFTSVHAHAVDAENGQSGQVRSVRAVLDLVSKPGDPLLVWTNDPWPYISYDRVSATRFIWSSFLTGQVYLGRKSDAYVLPHTWDWFRSDLARSRPAGDIRAGAEQIPPGSPFAQYVAANFTTVYPDPNTPVSVRTDVASAIVDPATPDPWRRPGASNAATGWSVAGNAATFTDAGNRDADRLAIASDSCFSLRGSVDSDGPPGGITFHFDDNAGSFEPVKIDFDGDRVSSASENVEFAHLGSGTSSGGPVDFVLVVGRRSAALVVGGQVRAALRLPASVHVSVTAQRSRLQLRDLQLGAAPPGSGC